MKDQIFENSPLTPKTENGTLQANLEEDCLEDVTLGK